MDQQLQNYARLAVRYGVNVQKGEPVFITCEVEHAEFAREVVKICYELGAEYVEMNWKDSPITRMLFEHAPVSYFEEFPDWIYERMRLVYEKRTNIINIISGDPDLLNGIDMEKIVATTKAQNEKMKPLMKYSMNDIISWTIIALPNAPWAKKVFPDLPEEEAVAKLMEAIMDVTRMNEENPMQAWDAHLKRLTDRAQKLNEYDFAKVQYKSANGTDLTVGLPEGHIWASATSKNEKGTDFLPNIPTEEVFTAPHRDKVNGTLVSTKPLIYNGNTIDEFKLVFKDGAVTDFYAKKGGEFLKALLEEDKNARYLGEIALVPYDSPISNANILFYNTLFDENASCHFAFGACYPTTIKGGTDLSEEELMKIGGNDSAVHVDFMVGAKDLSIIGTTKDGKEIPIFIDGNFAF